jgi:hypothetical protein
MPTVLYSMNLWGVTCQADSYGGNAVERFIFTGFKSRPGYCCLECGFIRLPESRHAMTNLLINTLTLSVLRHFVNL